MRSEDDKSTVTPRYARTKTFLRKNCWTLVKFAFGGGALLGVWALLPRIESCNLRHFPEDHVIVTATWEKGKRCDDAHPIWVATKNESLRTVCRTCVQVLMRAPHFSTDRDGDAWYCADNLIAPGETGGMCWVAPAGAAADWKFSVQRGPQNNWGVDFDPDEKQ